MLLYYYVSSAFVRNTKKVEAMYKITEQPANACIRTILDSATYTR